MPYRLFGNEIHIFGLSRIGLQLTQKLTYMAKLREMGGINWYLAFLELRTNVQFMSTENPA